MAVFVFCFFGGDCLSLACAVWRVGLGEHVLLDARLCAPLRPPYVRCFEDVLRTSKMQTHNI